MRNDVYLLAISRTFPHIYLILSERLETHTIQPPPNYSHIARFIFDQLKKVFCNMFVHFVISTNCDGRSSVESGSRHLALADRRAFCIWFMDHIVDSSQGCEYPYSCDGAELVRSVLFNGPDRPRACDRPTLSVCVRQQE